MLVAATKRTSTVRLSFSPTRRTSPDSSARSSFACSAFDKRANLVEEERPALGVLDEARRARRPRR